MSPDWSASPSGVPYADLFDPQSLNLYGYVRNNPISRVDKDGHDCCDWNAAKQFTAGAMNAYASDTSVGAIPLQQQTSFVGGLGALLGHTAVAIQGVVEADAGITTVGGGVAACATGVGCAAGAPAIAIGVATTSHAAAAGGTAVTNLMKAGGNFSSATKKGAKDAAEGKCKNCGIETAPGQKSQKGVTPPSNEGQTDHIQPKSKGGTNDPTNAQHLCRDCNIKKSDKITNQ